MSSHSILIVDDAAETRLFLKSLVSSLGYAPFEAKNGPEALKALSEHKIDLILLDILMPNMDGYQLLEIINNMRGTRHFRVAFVTGVRGELDQEKLAILKPDEVIHKTTDVQVLKNKIKKLVSLSHSPHTSHQTAHQEKAGANEDAAILTTQPRAGEINFNATMTNMPIIMDVKLTKTSSSNLSFISPVQFKFGTAISFLSEDGARKLNKYGEIQSVVKNCLAFGDKFTIELDIL